MSKFVAIFSSNTIHLYQVAYDYRVDEFPTKNFDSKRHIGWIADEVEKVIPELVTTDEEGYKYVAYGRSTALLSGAINELHAKQKENVLRIEKLDVEVLELKDMLGKMVLEMEAWKKMHSTTK